MKSAVSKDWVYWTYDRINLLDISDLDWMGIDPALLSSAEQMNQIALTIRPQKPNGEQNRLKYIDRRSNDVTTGQKTMNEL